MSQEASAVSTAEQTTRQVVVVHRVRPATSWRVMTLSVHYGGMMTHFVRGRSRYCRGSECKPELHKTESFWRGYFAALLWEHETRQWRPVVQEVSEALELDLRPAYKRGQVWLLSRAKDERGRRAPTTGKLDGRVDPVQIPDEFDVRPVLLHLYHEQAISLGVGNPMPARLSLPNVPHMEGLKLLK